MIAFNVLTRKDFTNKEGKEKTLWRKVGVVKISQNGRTYLQLFHLPDVEFYLVEPNQENQKVKEFL